jgi:hypothetical protein
MEWGQVEAALEVAQEAWATITHLAQEVNKKLWMNW